MTFLPIVDKIKKLNKQEVERYSRHILLPEVGLDGQQRLKSAKVLVVGAGGLGSPALLYLAAAGVGSIGIADFDVVDESNLQRQVIHTQDRVGMSKAKSAEHSILALNPYVNVRLHEQRIDVDNAIELFEEYDLILDGTDNFATRYLVNDACVLAKKPYVWGSIYRFEGQASVFWEQAPDGRGINYRDLYPEPPPPEHAPSCSEGGVFGILCASIASIMATEAIKLITGIGDSLLGRLAVYDALDMNYRFIPLRQAPNRKAITELGDYEFFCGIKKTDVDAISSASVPSISVAELHSLRLSSTPHSLIDVREKQEWEIVNIEGATLIPKKDIDLESVLDSLDRTIPLVVHCKAGGRSKDVVMRLLERGFTNVKNLDGGILSWISEVEPTLPSY